MTKQEKEQTQEYITEIFEALQNMSVVDLAYIKGYVARAEIENQNKKAS